MCYSMQDDSPMLFDKLLNIVMFWNLSDICSNGVLERDWNSIVKLSRNLFECKSLGLWLMAVSRELCGATVIYKSYLWK